MSDFVPDVGEVRDSLVYLNKNHAKQYGDVDLMVVGSETAAQFDRMIASVERAAAARALEEAADEIFVQHSEPDTDKRMAFNRGADAVYDALRARAAEIREGKSA